MPDASEVVLKFDGGARGNPGPAAYGYVICAPDGETLASGGETIGTATNNVAEYRGLIEGLRRAETFGVRRVTARGDSELVIRQMRGEWRMRSPALRAIQEEARALAERFEAVRFEHVPREQNREADELVNAALDAASAPFRATGGSPRNAARYRGGS